jgi:transcriptional regulator with XRE-family HTH domain
VANDLRYAVGGNLRAIRKAQRLTQERFGYRYGYQRSWVGNVENAKLNLTMNSLQQLADRLEVEVFVLVRRPGEAAPPPPPIESRDEEEAG